MRWLGVLVVTWDADIKFCLLKKTGNGLTDERTDRWTNGETLLYVCIWMWIFRKWRFFDFDFDLKPISHLHIAVFVHDGINSVADYNSLRVGVGCRMDGWMDVGCMSPSKFHDGITFKRLEILSWNFVWCLILMICLGNEPMVNFGPPQPPLPPYPPPNWCDGLTSTIFIRFWRNLVWKSILGGNA